jgi:hypothetical protein
MNITPIIADTGQIAQRRLPWEACRSAPDAPEGRRIWSMAKLIQLSGWRLGSRPEATHRSFLLA